MQLIAEGVELDERYRVVRLLGEGAMGAVYEAEHVVIGRRVAVKVMHPRFAKNADAVTRFTREARAAAAIGHPNIVAVTDFGTHHMQPFLVMELLRGETLGERMVRVPSFPAREACLILGQVLSALDAAHAIGVVHRDLKPENVFLCDDRGGHAKLLDFGVSKFKPAGAHLDHVTRDGTPVGTPSYMAPEQWEGLPDVDHRADLYAAGVMLYELLTGALPFEGSSDGQLYGVVVHGTEAAAPPSSLSPELPPELDAVVMQAIERDRAKRFQSAEAFLEALRPFGAEAELLRVAEARARPSSKPPPGAREAHERKRRRAMVTTQPDGGRPEPPRPRASTPPPQPPQPARAPRWAGLVAAALAASALGVGVWIATRTPPPPAQPAPQRAATPAAEPAAVAPTAQPAAAAPTAQSESVAPTAQSESVAQPAREAPRAEPAHADAPRAESPHAASPTARPARPSRPPSHGGGRTGMTMSREF